MKPLQSELKQSDKLKMLDEAGFPSTSAPPPSDEDAPVVLQATDIRERLKRLNVVGPIEWEPPIPFGSAERPLFPVHCLPAAVKGYVLAVSEALQVPVDMAAVTALGAMAACVQGKFNIQCKPDWTEPLNLYIVLIANPAERKSPVLNAMTKYIDEHEYNVNAKMKAEIEQNRLEKRMLQKTVERLLDAAAKDPKKKDALLNAQEELSAFEDKKPERVLADDATMEALASLAANNGGIIALFSSEPGVFDIAGGRYSNGANLDFLLKAHCGDPVRIDRKGRESEYIPNPCLTMLLCAQPHAMEGIMSNAGFRGRGLTARFLYCQPMSPVGSRRFEVKPVSHDEKEAYRQLCLNLLEISNAEPETLMLSPEAYTVNASFANELEPRLINDLEFIADFAGKLHGAILRIAGILHVVQNHVFAADTPVSEDTMMNAIEIGYYFLEHAISAYQIMGSDEKIQNAKYILRQLEKGAYEEIKQRDLLRLCRRFKSVDEMLPAVALLEEFGYIRRDEQEYRGTGRRPDDIIKVHPCVTNVTEVTKRTI